MTTKASSGNEPPSVLAYLTVEVDVTQKSRDIARRAGRDGW
ncbi:hypothetical protein [Arthrobacter alpinus]|nr:hypothetical protein [Arthrobacter alpinus]